MMNLMRVDEEINASDANLLDEKPKDALTNNMNFDEKLGTYVIDIYPHANAPTVANLCSTIIALSTSPNYY